MTGLGQQPLGREKDIAKFWVGDGVEDLSALTRPVHHQTALTQARQMVGHVRLRRPNLGDEVRHSPLTIEQLQQDRQPSRIAQAVEQPRGDTDLDTGRLVSTHPTMIDLC